SANLAGILTDLRQPHGTLSMKATLSVREAVELFRLPIARSGTASFDGDVSVSLADSMQFTMHGRVNARGLGLVRDRLKVEGAEVRSEIRITPDKVALNGITLHAAGAKISGDAEVSAWSRFHFAGSFSGLSVRDAARFVTDRQIPWNGMLAGELVVDGV